MQNAKDTFYITLRDRLAGLNPGRTMVVRGLTRPGTLVEENELASAYQPVNAFCLKWTGLRVVSHGAMTLVGMQCEVKYATDGSAGNGGMDRGRLLAGMDAELAGAVNAEPQRMLKSGFGSGAGAVGMGTKVFWTDVSFGAAMTAGERLERVAVVEVFTYQEAGEL